MPRPITVFDPATLFEPSQSPLRLTVASQFYVENADHIAFYSSVYNGGGFERGQIYNHTDYIVTPQFCFNAELESIIRIRQACGIEYHGRPFTRWKVKLPRNEIEPLPLPG